jgi:hypothetical protein
MSRHGYSHSSGSDFGDAAAGGLVAMVLVITLITAYLTFKACCYIIQTFVKYGKTVKPLKYSLVVFIALSIIGWMLALIFQRPEFSTLISLGFLQLFLTCVVIQRQNAQTFMIEDISIQEAILKRKWWDDNTSLAA